jgi:hypothetical protein
MERNKHSDDEDEVSDEVHGHEVCDKDRNEVRDEVHNGAHREGCDVVMKPLLQLTVM